jgi:hypothetical protein
MRSILVSAALAAALFSTGCLGVATPALGVFVTDVKGPIGVGDGVGTSKTGRACAQSIMGLVAMGDASIEAAKKAGGIKKVTTVDHESKWTIVFGTYCTVVTGE